jgi:hypothetical protein
MVIAHNTLPFNVFFIDYIVYISFPITYTAFNVYQWLIGCVGVKVSIDMVIVPSFFNL